MAWRPSIWGHWSAILVLSAGAFAWADPPTMDEILAIHRTNHDGLSQRHMQWVHTYETTEAHARAEEQRRAEKATLSNMVLQTKPDEFKIVIDGKTIVGEEAIQLLQQAGVIEVPRPPRRREPEPPIKPFQVFHPMELFLHGNDYQFRSPAQSINTNDELQNFSFAAAPLTPESLTSTYRDYSIFSRSSDATPPARWWHRSVGKHAYITQKHYDEVHSINLPPYTDLLNASWDRRHAFDHFFSQPAEKYRVVRQEELDDREVTVVDVRVPIGEPPTLFLGYRAWLDLKRGAIPLRLFHSQLTAEAPADVFDRKAEPSETMTTDEIRELPGGLFYPTKTVAERWQHDPEKPREVHSRHRWECSLIEVRTDWPKGFFVFPFPENQQLFDHDAGKMIGAIEPQPLVKVGQPAPPLTIGRWLDGKTRTLDDFKGQVVVLDFWGLWCGACRSSVPEKIEFQKEFAGKPVVFLSIHTADRDQNELTEQIDEFRKKSGWEGLAAIDSGTMIENSVTTMGYGAQMFPLRVIIGRDGRIAYVDPQDISIDGDETDPIQLAEFERKSDEFFKTQFEAVGETWPLPEDLDDESKEKIFQRVQHQYIAHEIQRALQLPAK
jgi:thiol-disulfide isomerase/thioredoxin